MQPHPSSSSSHHLRPISSSSLVEGSMNNGRSMQSGNYGNFLLQNPQLLEQIKVDYFESILYDFLFEVAIDFLWSVKTGNTSLDEVYNCQPLIRYVNIPIKYEESEQISIARPPIPIEKAVNVAHHTSNRTSNYNSSSNHQVISSSSSSGGSSKSIYCPICNELVGAVRFAYHLEKCMNGGKRGTRKHYDYLRDDVLERPRPKKEFVDPHPDSMIVRIKLRNGVPYGNTRRIGVSLEEFQTCQEEERRLIKNGTADQSSHDSVPSQNYHEEEDYDQNTVDSVP